MSSLLQKLQKGCHHDPFEVLGRHSDNKNIVIRAFLPNAESVDLIGVGPMQRVPKTDFFESRLTSAEDGKMPRHYALRFIEKHDGSEHEVVSPYSFEPQLGELDKHLFAEGHHWEIYRHLGAHLTNIDGVDGCLFAVWVPNVQRVSIVGDFNGWHGLRHSMRCLGFSGIWELFVPGLHPADAYKFEILTPSGAILHKSDPYARAMSVRPETTSLVPVIDKSYQWTDTKWMKRRQQWDWLHAPVSIYEIHAGSWQHSDSGEYLNYRELAARLIPYVQELGYTHIELLPITEYPLDESWGYQVTGYYAPTSRYGSADDLRYFIDACHEQGIGVILDWVPAHFPKDEFALARFNGEPLYEYGEIHKGEHQEWGTLIFNYGRREVQNFLIANALYWINEFHIDGLRVDAVASMLYLDYSRNEGEWEPNQYGGREHIEAISFIKELNTQVHAQFPGVLTIAEESTSWPMVSRPIDMGGLGFSMKWNMGWMNDTLDYFKLEPVHRRFHQNQLTFSQLYAWTENFVLPLSHDEVVHGKLSLLSKMPGDNWQKFANLRLLFAYQFAHPGKKLLFMGGEIAQWTEWSEKKTLDWALCEHDTHTGIRQLVKDLNQLYVSQPAMHRYDFESEGFRWISCDDADNSVLAFIRSASDVEIICVFNFTPVPRENYQIGVPLSGDYLELLNTDAACYGGSNSGNVGKVSTSEI
ncbi:MAG: 1,4-alpha-glucan branching protein GlgB, partial [Gammaproteobacteria bacterium]|nr:1,4-alpha-glucan branching protein GlgB [Gammaproteobacteria bacterium]